MAPRSSRGNNNNSNNCCPFSQKHIDILRSLCLLPPTERRILLRHIDLKLTRCICECAYNILHGTVKLLPEQKAQLAKHASLLRQLVKKGEKIEKKRKIVQQRGGGAFLPSLLIPVLSALVATALE